MSWQDFIARHPVGDVIEGVVTKQVPFGSFVEPEGFTGLADRQSWPAAASRSGFSRSIRNDSASAWPRPNVTAR